MNKEIPLSSQVAGWLANAAFVCTGFASVLALADPLILGISQEVLLRVVGILGLTASLLGVLVVMLRRNQVPIVTSGVGLEVPGVTETTTLTTETKVTP
jgi:hypothetical protein